MSEETELAGVFLKLAERAEAAPHMDRGLNADIGSALGESFHHAFTSYVDCARIIVPVGYLWSVGVSVDYDKENAPWAWANVHTPEDYPRRFDASTRAETPALALCATALRVRAYEIYGIVGAVRQDAPEGQP